MGMLCVCIDSVIHDKKDRFAQKMEYFHQCYFSIEIIL